jgi:hypothetical protein
MVDRAQKLESLRKTALGNKETSFLVGRIIRKEFDEKDISEETAEDLLFTAYVLRVPQFEEMLDDFLITDFKN